MELNKHPLGWLPDYPDWRDLTMNNISDNINTIQDKSPNPENTESPILKLAKLIQDANPDNLALKQSIDEFIKKNPNEFIKKNDNEFNFLNVKRENRMFLYRGSRNDKVRDLQKLLKNFFYDDVGQKNQYKIRDYNFSEATKNTLRNQSGDFRLESKRGYFGEATHQIMICFKKIWELPSENSIVDCDFNPEQNDQEQDQENYQYKPDITIYQVLEQISYRLKPEQQSKQKKDEKHIKIGDCDSKDSKDESDILRIVEIKEHLEYMGYFDFPSKEANGNYEESKHFFGYKTDLVVEFFQGINGLYPDGIVGQWTHEKLVSKDSKEIIKLDKETIKQEDESAPNEDLHRKLDGNPMVYIQKKLQDNFGCKKIRLNGKPDDEGTIEAIRNNIDETIGKTITLSSLKKLLEKIIEKAEKSKQYSLSQPSNFYKENTESSEQKSCSSEPKQDSALFRVQEPISKNIIKIFQDKLILKPSLEDNKDKINITDETIPIIHSVIQLVIKKISGLGIHGQLDYEQAISQAIDLINIILAKKSSSSPKNADKDNQFRGDISSSNSDNNTNFFLEFMRGKRERNSEINLVLIYESLSAKDKQEINFLIFITLDKIYSMYAEKKDSEKFIKFIKTSKKRFKKKIKSISDNQNSDGNSLDSGLTTKPKNNNQTILQVLPLSDEPSSKPKQLSDPTPPHKPSSKPEQLSILVKSELKESIKISQKSHNPVYLCLPEFVDLSYWCSPVKNQEPLNSCTACAAITLVEYFQNRTADKYTNASVLFLYKVARKLMLREGDVGASIRETMKAMVLFGIPPEEYWPYEPSKMDEEPTGFCYSYAQNYQTIQYLRLDTPGLPASDLLAQIKMTLVAGLPSMFGLTIYSSIYEDANYKRGYIPTPNQKDHVEGGHALVAIGYDDHKMIGGLQGALLVINSWGTKWGEKGYGWLPYDYILLGLTSDWWSLVKAEWFETMAFGLGINDWKHNNTGEQRGDGKGQ